ncbi:MAG: ATP-binding protein, partial [Gemmatimonadaceae bacterium]|nr:ATP-binding protein [Gemmatimonadaceae bacterium]
MTAIALEPSPSPAPAPAIGGAGGERVALSWSGGKDCALALELLRADPAVEVVALLASITEDTDRVAMHGVRRALLLAQSDALGVPLVEVRLPPWPTNQQYAYTMGVALTALRQEGVQQVAFGDLFLEDLRDFRDAMLRPLGLRPSYPLWGRDTRELARGMLDDGYRAT